MAQPGSAHAPQRGANHERLDVVRNGVMIPACVWRPATTPRAIVLALHGGSGHKASPAILAIAASVTRRGCALLAIDGPVHGERRTDGDLSPAAAIAAFREAWRAGVGRTDIAADFSAALDRLKEQHDYRDCPVGYIGVSMGTAYGIPLLARERRIRAAAIGLWSVNYVASAHLAEYAGEVECPVWFTQQWNDEYFDREGTAELFDSVGSRDKRLVVYPGTHRELEGPRLDDAVTFVVDRLVAPATGGEA